eukprot:SAG31_NODE_27625_length_423_cov_0.564815_2_plen_90_part_01
MIERLIKAGFEITEAELQAEADAATAAAAAQKAEKAREAATQEAEEQVELQKLGSTEKEAVDRGIVRIGRMRRASIAMVAQDDNEADERT